LEELNKEMFDEIQNHLLAAVENCIAGMRYFRVQHDGPHIKEVSAKKPLVPR
jgi:glycogen debranching enzyme